MRSNLPAFISDMQFFAHGFHAKQHDASVHSLSKNKTFRYTSTLWNVEAVYLHIVGSVFMIHKRTTGTREV